MVLRKLFDSKHVFLFMLGMIFFSGGFIQILMEKDTWLLYGEATILNTGLGILISGVVCFLIGWAIEWNQRRTGSGVYDKKDLFKNAKGIGLGAIVAIIATIVLWVVSIL